MISIPYTRPSITELEIEYVNDAVKTGWGPRCYEYIERFEEEFAHHLDVKFAIATSSCTGALHLGLAAMGLGPGDEVILADSNWIATIAPVVHLGAKPVFVDVLEATWCIDPEQVELAITEKTRAIIATHLYGNLCDMDALLEIGERRGVPVVEDAAEAIGSVHHGKPAGSMGLFGVFSFHGSKTMTTGEGGMLVTNDKSLFDRALTLGNHGRSREQPVQFWPDEVGYKFKMSNVQAAMGVAQLSRIVELVDRKREILSAYNELFSQVPGLKLNPEQENCESGAWMPNLVTANHKPHFRDKALEAFRSRGIDGRVFFWPLSSLHVFGGKAMSQVAVILSNCSINLPSFHDMLPADIERVVETLLPLLEQKT